MIIVYIRTPDLYAKKGGTLPLCSWEHPLIPLPGDTLTIEGVQHTIGKVQRIFEPHDNDLIINVAVWFQSTNLCNCDQISWTPGPHHKDNCPMFGVIPNEN